jgi:DNA repair photolyase
MPQELVGIARLAHAAPTLESKRAVEYLQLPAFKLLNRAPRHMPFEWTVNPYRGCEIGCKYCYARYTHEFMELRDPLAFEERSFAKQWNPAEFLADLRRIDPRDRIAIGTATDPYQPAERRFRLTRALLETLAGQRGRRLGITTKSDLVARDIDVLQSVARHNRVSVHLTVTTVDDELARKIEPRAPRPDLRLAAVRKLADAGIETGVFCCPLLPLITDSQQQIHAVASAAKDAGARFLAGNTVFLKQSALRVFLPFLDEQFPELADRYRRRFEGDGFLRGAYPKLIHDRVQRAREKFGLDNEPATRSAGWAEEAQLSLFAELAQGSRAGE